MHMASMTCYEAYGCLVCFLRVNGVAGYHAGGKHRWEQGAAGAAEKAAAGRAYLPVWLHRAGNIPVARLAQPLSGLHAASLCVSYARELALTHIHDRVTCYSRRACSWTPQAQ